MCKKSKDKKLKQNITMTLVHNKPLTLGETEAIIIGSRNQVNRNQYDKTNGVLGMLHEGGAFLVPCFVCGKTVVGDQKFIFRYILPSYIMKFVAQKPHNGRFNFNKHIFNYSIVHHGPCDNLRKLRGIW